GLLSLDIISLPLRANASLSGLFRVRLEPVAVGVRDECRVIAIAVLRPDAGFAVVVTARLERTRVEGVHGLSARRVEADVEAGFWISRDWLLGFEPPELRCCRAITEIPLAFREALVAQRRQGGVVEAPRRLEIADADRDVIDHGSSPRCQMQS